jgi:hypothetical protein
MPCMNLKIIWSTPLTHDFRDVIDALKRAEINAKSAGEDKMGSCLFHMRLAVDQMMQDASNHHIANALPPKKRRRITS